MRAGSDVSNKNDTVEMNSEADEEFGQNPGENIKLSRNNLGADCLMPAT
jgi:hypothetical protein